MKYTTVALAFFAAVTAAEKIEDLVTQLPACALPCFQAATGEIGCKDGDFACQCSKVNEFTKAVLPCVTKQCKPEDLGTIQITANKICKEVESSGSSSGGDDKASPSSAGGSSPTTTASGSKSTSEAATAGGSRVEAGLLAGVVAAMAFL